jgi:EmrB/QacA subfamily drug resistance transporter
MSRSDKIALVAALMAVMFLGALDVTIVTIAAPSISGALGGFGAISFLFSTYTLTSSVTVPIFGKLADLHGRKKILLIGIAIFLIGSLLCAISQDMLMLILSRAVQGAGTGAIFTLVNTIIGDVFELKVRSAIIGAVSTVWGVASLVGPFAGGILIDNLSWHWIFLINIPISILAMILLALCFHENFQRRKARFDFAGAVLLSLLILGALLGINAITTPETSLGGGLGTVIVCTAVALVSLVAFILVEKRAADPIVPRNINTRTTTVVNIASFVSAIVLIGASVYQPMFFQEVLGLSPTMSGVALLPESAVWLLMSFILATLLIRFGDRRTMLVLAAFMVLGFALFLLLSPETPPWLAACIIAFSSIGLGGVLNATLLIIQESVGIENRGAAVGFNSMLKSVGQAIGIGLLGGVFNIRMLSLFNEQGIPPSYLDNPRDAIGSVSEVTNMLINTDFSLSLGSVFLVFLVLAAITLAIISQMPRDKNSNDNRSNSD